MGSEMCIRDRINNYYPGALPRLIAVFRAQSEEAFYLQATGYETAYLLKIDSTGEEVFRREDRCFGGSMFQMEDGGFLCLYVRNPINEADSLEVGMTWLSAEAEVIADDVVYLPNGVRGCLPQPDGSLVHYGRVEPPEFIEKTYVTRLDANHRQVNRREFYFPAPREAIQTSDGGFLFGVTDYQLYAISLLRLSPDGLFAPTRNPSPSSSYLLLTAYPNPFNCSTTVSYMLTLPGWSAVDVVDINGRVMTRLFEGWMSAGLHRVVWDGAGIPSGRYFVRLETTAGKRMATGVEVVR